MRPPMGLSRDETPPPGTGVCCVMNTTGCPSQTLIGRPSRFAGLKRMFMATMPAAASSASWPLETLTS